MEAPWWRRQQQRRLSPNLLSPSEISSSLFTHNLPCSWQLHFIYFFPSLCRRCQRRRRLFPASIWLIEELIASIRSETDRDGTPTAIEVSVLFDLESAFPRRKWCAQIEFPWYQLCGLGIHSSTSASLAWWQLVQNRQNPYMVCTCYARASTVKFPDPAPVVGGRASDSGGPTEQMRTAKKVQKKDKVIKYLA